MIENRLLPAQRTATALIGVATALAMATTSARADSGAGTSSLSVISSDGLSNYSQASSAQADGRNTVGATSGSGWHTAPSGSIRRTATLADVAVTASGEAWVVGQDGDRAFIARSTSGAWTTKYWGATGKTFSLHAVDAKRGVVWAVGSVLGTNGQQKPLILVNNGTGWKVQPPPAAAADVFLNSVAIASAGDVWMTGGDSRGSLTLHWDGSRLTSTILSIAGWPYAVDALPNGPAVLVGESTSTYSPQAWHRNGDGWQEDPMPPRPFGEESWFSSVDVGVKGTWATGWTEGGCCFVLGVVNRWTGSRWVENRPPPQGLDVFEDVLVSRIDGHVTIVGWAGCDPRECSAANRAVIWEWTGLRWLSQEISGLPTGETKLFAIDGDGHGGRLAVGSASGHPLLLRQIVGTG